MLISSATTPILLSAVVSMPRAELCMQGSWWEQLWAEPPVSEAAAATVAGLCREQGWEVRCTLGSRVARGMGGTGTLALQREESSTVGIDFTVAFELEEGYDPPQGIVRLLSPSKYLSSSTAAEESQRAAPGAKPAVSKGFWSVDTTDDEGVPTVVVTAVVWRLECGRHRAGRRWTALFRLPRGVRRERFGRPVRVRVRVKVRVFQRPRSVRSERFVHPAVRPAVGQGR